jgi:hypothetical protein
MYEKMFIVFEIKEDNDQTISLYIFLHFLTLLKASTICIIAQQQKNKFKRCK